MQRKPLSFTKISSAIILISLMVSSTSSLMAQTTSWIDGNNGSWTDSANWTNGVPTSASIVSINDGDVVQDATNGAVVDSLTYGFGLSTLELQADLTVSGNMNWTAGTILGPGALNLTGTAVVGDGDLEGTVNSTADVNLTPSVRLSGSPTAIWNNQAGSSFNFTESAEISSSVPGTFNNEAGAVLQRTGSGLEATLAWNLNSFGLIRVDESRLVLAGNTFIDGDVQIASGAALDLRPSFVNFGFGANATVNGGGVLELSGPTTINDTLNVNTDMRLDGGGELLGSGVLNVNGFLDWDGSFTMGGTGTTNLNGDSLIQGGQDLERTLNNYGYVDYQSSLRGRGASSVWRNKADATFDITNDADLSSVGSYFNEPGALLVKSAGTLSSNISWDVFNDGTIEVSSGTLWFRGDFQQGSTGELQLDGGTLEFSNFLTTAGGSISGSGTIDSDFARVTANFDPGILDFTGDLFVDSGSTMDFDVGMGQDLVTVGGDLTLNGILNVFELPSLQTGTYTLFSYAGSFTDNGVALGTTPSGFNFSLLHDSGNMEYCLLYTSPSPRDQRGSRMPSSA